MGFVLILVRMEYLIFKLQPKKTPVTSYEKLLTALLKLDFFVSPILAVSASEYDFVEKV